MVAEKKNNTPNVPALRFPEFSGEWEYCKIKDFGKVVTGNTPSTKISEYYDNGHCLWAGPGDLGQRKYVYNTKIKLSDKGFLKVRRIPCNSILVTCIGSTIGKMGMAVGEMATNQQINAVIPENCDPNFAYYAISHRFPKYLDSIAVQAVPILSKSTFENLDNCRAEMAEQIKIGNFLKIIDERIDIQTKIIEELTTLRSALAEKCSNQSGE